MCCDVISQLPKLCVKISILRHRRVWVRSFSTRLTSVTFAEDKVLIFLILRKNAKIVQLSESNPNPNTNFRSRLIR